jgi:Zn-dependent membrane protease YugP
MLNDPLLGDPLFYIIILPGVLLSLWAQRRVSSAFADGRRVPAMSRLSGAEGAARILNAAGITQVRIEPVTGQLTDHYDPSQKVLRLSEDVYEGRSVAAVGIAGHEAGHAFQDFSGYPGLVVRNAIVPLASIGSSIWFLVFVAGLMIGFTSFVVAGILLFLLTLAIQLLNLPVEFDASRRARIALRETGVIAPEEERIIGRVLDAAAWTYVAAALTGALQLIYLLVRSGLLNRGRHD